MHPGLTKTAVTALGLVTCMLMATSASATVVNGLIAYPCETGGGTPDRHQNICLIDPAAPVPADTKEQITFDGDNGLPSWSPDGKFLAYTNIQDIPSLGGVMPRIYVMDINTRASVFIGPGVAPAWSPNGTQIAFTWPAESAPDRQEIWAMNVDGSNRHQLTDAPSADRSQPTWSPDSQSIAYSQFTPDHTDVTVGVTNLVTHTSYDLTGPLCSGPSPCFQNLDADGNVILEQPVDDAGAPAWSPKSNEIAYWSGLEGYAGQVWKINSDQTGRTQLTFPPKPPYDLPYPNSDDPAWSPDGTKFLFSTNRTIIDVPFDPFHIALPEVWVMDADGGNAHPLVFNAPGPMPGRAAWQPLLVPEPASLALLAGALLGFGLIRRRLT